MVDDGRTTTTDDDDGPWLYYKLTNELKGSGELNMQIKLYQKTVKNIKKLHNMTRGNVEEYVL